MNTTVYGLFQTFAQAEDAIQALIDAGVRREDLSIVANDVRGSADGNTAGALLGVRALTLAGIGPVRAVGPLAAALGDGDDLAQAIAASGIAAAQADQYAEGVRRGGALVAARDGQQSADEIAQLLAQHGALNIEQQGAAWRSQGWQRFDRSAQPYSADEIEHHWVRGSFATGLAEHDLVEGSSVEEGSFATGMTEQPAGETTEPISPEEVRAGGSFASGQAAGQPRESSNQPEDSFDKGQGRSGT